MLLTILSFHATSPETIIADTVLQSEIPNGKYSSHLQSHLHDRKIFSDALESGETLQKLSDSLSIHPAKIWKLNHRFKNANDLVIDESEINKFIDHSYNPRLVGKLYKVLKGEDVQLSVIGGSNLGGAGVQEDEPGGAQGLFPYVIDDWWAKAITPLTGSKLNLNLVSIGGTASDFYQYCHRLFLTRNLDLVLIETSVNDLNIRQQYETNRSLALEQWTRQLLVHPTQPALVYVNLYQGARQKLGCENLEDYGQSALTRAYHITTIRWRDLVCPVTTPNVRKPRIDVDVFCNDKDHINLFAHAQVSLIIINMIRDLLLKIIANKGLVIRSLSVTILPKPVYIRAEKNIISYPLCWTTVTSDYRKYITNDFDVKVVKNYLFQYQPLTRLGYKCEPPRVCRTDAYSGWFGDKLNANLIISFVVPHREQEEGIEDARSVVLVTRTCPSCGMAQVWIDNDYEDRELVDAKVWGGQTCVRLIAKHVLPGIHTLTIQVVETANFILAGVILGPPDGSH